MTELGEQIGLLVEISLREKYEGQTNRNIPEQVLYER